LIMDEPPAGLDARAEARPYDTFHELTAGATTVAISHRFATVRRAQREAAFRAGRNGLREGFDRVLWLTGAALVWVSSALLMASVVSILVVLPLFAVPVLLATRRADRARGAAVERAAPRTGLAERLFTLAATAGPGRETRLFGLAGELRRRHREQWDSGGREIVVADPRSRIPLALAWLVFVLAYASAIVPPPRRQAASLRAVHTTGCVRTGDGSRTPCAGLPVIMSSRTAWFSAARNVARIRSKVDALIGWPYRFRRRPRVTNIRASRPAATTPPA
ncbi:hypothetical protein ACWEPN_11700, partial [Nonomuraea wenchangensis]